MIALALLAAPLAWDPAWRGSDWPEYAVTIGLLGVAGGTRALFPDPPLGFKEGVLFDDPLRELLRAESPAGRLAADDASDALQLLMIAWPFTELGALSLADRVDRRLAAEMLAIDLQANALSLALVTLSKAVVGRVRPDVAECPGPEPCTSSASRASFFSGHTAAAFTGAGLVCLQHQMLPLWGRLDGAACPLALAASTATALLRVVADRHWATDVLGGAAVGLAAGWALPYLLHFGAERVEVTPSDERLRASLRLLGVAGLLSESGPPHAIFGARWMGQVLWWPSEDWLAIEGHAEGALMRSVEDRRIARAEIGARLWWRGVALGFAGDLRSVGVETRHRAAWTLGPTLAIGLFDRRESALVLGGRWAPLLDGDGGTFEARLDLSALRYLDAALEVMSLARPGAPSVQIFLASLGGRLPW